MNLDLPALRSWNSANALSRDEYAHRPFERIADNATYCVTPWCWGDRLPARKHCADHAPTQTPHAARQAAYRERKQR
jgi:hypothetical protein